MSVWKSWFWLGQNYGPIFRRLWTKVHQITLSCSGVIVVCNAVFRLMISCSIVEILAIKSRSCLKSRRNFAVFGPPNFLGEGPPNFLPNFINYSHHRTYGKVWWQSVERPPRLGGEKKERKKETSAVKHNGLRGHYPWRAAITTSTSRTSAWL